MSTITVRELKALLEGMDMLQGKTWTPTAQQWKKIRQKINMLEDEEVVLVSELEEDEYMPPPQAAARPRAPMPATPPPSMIPSTIDAAAAPAVAPQPMPPVAPRPMTGPDGKTKTPDIDTTSGQYTSGFE